MRSALSPHARYSALHHARLQIAQDQFQHRYIFHLAPHTCDERVVVYKVEEFLQIKIYGTPLTCRNVALRSLNGLMRVATGTETEAGNGKIRVEQRLQYLTECLLNQTIARVGTPRIRTPPCGFGIYTLRTISG